jgi:hypothetical protein
MDIAIVNIHVWQKDQPRRDMPADLRYTLWKTRQSDLHAVSQARAILRYKNTPLQEILAAALVTFNVRGVVAYKTYEDNEDTGHFDVHLNAKVEEQGKFEVAYLGDHEGIECYAIINRGGTTLESGKPGKGSFSISHMPDYGYATVVYQADNVRDIFTNISHAGDPSLESALFEFIDSHVQALFSPQPVTEGTEP